MWTHEPQSCWHFPSLFPFHPSYYLPLSSVDVLSSLYVLSSFLRCFPPSCGEVSRSRERWLWHGGRMQATQSGLESSRDTPLLIPQSRMLLALPELCSGCDDDGGPPWCWWAWRWLLRWLLLRWWLPWAAGWLVQDGLWLAEAGVWDRDCSLEPFNTSSSRLSSLPWPPSVIPPSLVIVYTLAGFTTTLPSGPLAPGGSSVEMLRSTGSRRFEGPEGTWAWRLLTWGWDWEWALGFDWLDWLGLAMCKQWLCGVKLLLCKRLMSGESQSWLGKVLDNRWSRDRGTEKERRWREKTRNQWSR